VVVGHLEDVPPVRWAIGAARVARSTLCRDGEDSAACRAATMPSVPESICRRARAARSYWMDALEQRLSRLEGGAGALLAGAWRTAPSRGRHKAVIAKRWLYSMARVRLGATRSGATQGFGRCCRCATAKWLKIFTYCPRTTGCAGRCRCCEYRQMQVSTGSFAR
jgi:hypothetical protein